MEKLNSQKIELREEMGKKINYFQGIRGVFCIVVYLCHFFALFEYDANVFLLSDFGRQLLAPFRGACGVAVFAVLSGYFAGETFLSHKDNLANGFFRRYIKLWIPIFIINCAWYGVAHLFSRYDSNCALIIFDAGLPFRKYFFSSFLLDDSIVGIFWPIQSFFIGSVLVHLIMWLAKDNRQATFFLVGVAICTCLFGNRIIDIVCLGAILSINKESKYINVFRNKYTKILVFVLAWECFAINDRSTRIGTFVLGMGAMLLIGLVANGTILKKIFSAKPLVYIGNISYEIFCVHFVILSIFLLGKDLWKTTVKIGSLTQILIAVGAFVLTIILSKCLNWVVKKLFIIIRKIDVSQMIRRCVGKLKISNCKNEKENGFIILLGIFSILLWTYVYNSSMSTEGMLGNYSQDYWVHTLTANNIFNGINNEQNIYMQVVYTYPLYHACTKILSIITSCSVQVTAGIIIDFFVILTILIVRKLYSKYNYNRVPQKIINLLSFGSVLLINLYVPCLTTTVYYPQGAPNLWHNPTFLVSRPFAILSVYYFFRSYKNNREQYGNALKWFMISSFLCSLAKPSFSIVFLPVAGIFVLIRLIRNPLENIKYAICCLGAVIPTLILNVVQLSWSRLNERGSYHLFTEQFPLDAGLKYLAVMIIFPLFVFLVRGYKETKSSVYLGLWATTILGWFEYYHTILADFIWGYEMAAFMLVAYSAYLLFLNTEGQKKEKIIGAIIWGTQVLIGMFYFATGVLGSNLLY